MGVVKSFIGGMGAGKSTYAILEHQKLELEKLKVYVIKPAQDTRDGGVIKSRIINKVINADLVLKEEDDIPIEVLTSPALNVHTIIVDEVQMFSVKQIKQLLYIVARTPINIMFFGLANSWKNIPFPATALAVLQSDEVTILKRPNERSEGKSFALMVDSNGEPADITQGNSVSAVATYKALTRSEYYDVYNDVIYKSLWEVKE